MANTYAWTVIRLVLFDIDGTLVHTGGAGVKAFAKVFATEFNAIDGFERMKFAGRTDVSLVREFFEYHRIPPLSANFARFFSRYVFWLDHLLRESQTQVCPGVWEFIYGMQTSACPPLLGLLTGNIRLGAEIKLRHFRVPPEFRKLRSPALSGSHEASPYALWNFFTTGAFADDHEHRDEIAAIARERGCRILGADLHHDEVLVIGDTHLDIQCARAIGAKVLAVASGGATLDALAKHKPDWAVQDLTNIAIADALGLT